MTREDGNYTFPTPDWIFSNASDELMAASYVDYGDDEERVGWCCGCRVKGLRYERLEGGGCGCVSHVGGWA